MDDILENTDQKINDLLTATTKTASEFYEKVYLDRAVQAIPQAGGPAASFKSLVSSASSDGIAVEAFLFGLYVLCAVILALLADKPPVSRIDRALEQASPFRRGKRMAGRKDRRQSSAGGGN